MRVWRRLYVLLVIALVVTPLLALAPIPLSPVSDVREASAAPTFYLPWKGGQNWLLTFGNFSGEHNSFYPEYNNYAFDAQPLGADESVVAIAEGTVIASVNTIKYSDDIAYKEANSGGNCVAIDHGGGVYSMYAHMAEGSVPVSVGAHVNQGQTVGHAGRTGFVFANSPLLHWTVTNTRPNESCVGGISSPSQYADVPGDGVPRDSTRYTSGNYEAANPEPALPAETVAPTEAAAPTATTVATETSVATETAAPGEVIAPVETSVPTETVAPDPAPATEPPAAQSGSSTAAGTKDISLITRPQTGGLLTGACYILTGYSNEGCDDNGDGQVTFDDVPYGTYTVHQTQVPAGHSAIDDFSITVDDSYPNAPVGYLVKQSTQQNTASTRNTSVIFIDSSTGTKIVPASICLQFRNVSNEGCDRDLVDGQVDFLDLAIGTHGVTFSRVPDGWQVLAASPMTINPGPGPQIIYVEVETGSGASTGAGTSTETSSSNTSSGSGTDSGSVPAGNGAIEVIGGGQSGTASSGTSSSGTASTGPAVELILDTSDSMNERDQGGQSRLEVAKTVTTRLVTETLPAGVPMALRTYSGCSSSLAIPMQPLDPGSATDTIASLRASGKTPIAQSLRAAGGDLQGVSGPKIIVLVTDGEETCGGDPRAEIEALVAQNVDIQVNIVGFAIDDAALTATFQEWARVGNGTYFEASDAFELDVAVTTASQLPFRVLDGQGSVVAEGTVGGGPGAVPAGTYAVEIDTNPVIRRENVIVTAGQTTTIDLESGTVTGSSGNVVTGDQGGNAQVVPSDGGQSGNAQVIVPIEPDGGPQSSSVPAASTGTVNLLALLPSIAEVPGGLVETGRSTRTLPDVVANYTDPAGTSQRFTAWGWQGNAVASFALPSGQQARSGEINGVYVSIHQFGDAGAAREALDFSIAEDTAGSAVYEVSTVPLGEYTRSMYGSMDYGNEIIILVQQGDLLIRVAAAMLDGDPTGDAVAVTETILLKAGLAPTTGSASSSTAGAPSSAASTQDTWTASVQVVLCDESSGGGTCQAGAGITVNISLASGEWMGACTTSDPMPTPWGVSISTCAVEGLPFYEDFVATQDPSTIPAGYVPTQESVTLHVEGIHPGGGDEAIFNFSNVRSDTGATGSTITPGSGGSAEATLLMTFRGCPEGFDPAIGDFFSECTEPLDAPDASFISWGGDGQGGMSIWELNRGYNGEYVHNAKSATMNLRLTGLAPVVRDDYQVIGADGADGNGYTVNLADGETREVYVFYWFN